jgi:hypothetical protein
MDGVDENYDEPPPRQSPRQSSRQSSRQSPDGIAGLDMNIGSIVPSSAPDPGLRIRDGRVARFRRDSPRTQGSRSRSQSPDFDFDFHALGTGIGDDPNAAVHELTRAGLTNLTTRFAREAVPEAVQRVDQVVSSILQQTPQQRRRQQREQQRQQRQLLQQVQRYEQYPRLFPYRELINELVRECRNVQSNVLLNRLNRFIAVIERANLDESREYLLRLNRMLVMSHDRIRPRQNVTVSHSAEFKHAFETLGCTGKRARRAYYALISELRDQVVHRLDELNDITYQQYTPRPQEDLFPQHRFPQDREKGGARQTRKKTIKRNKTIKRR